MFYYIVDPFDLSPGLIVLLMCVNSNFELVFVKKISRERLIFGGVCEASFFASRKILAGRRLEMSEINFGHLLGSYCVRTLRVLVSHIANYKKYSTERLSIFYGGVCEARTRHLSYAIAALYRMS